MINDTNYENRFNNTVNSTNYKNNLTATINCTNNANKSYCDGCEYRFERYFVMMNDKIEKRMCSRLVINQIM